MGRRPHLLRLALGRSADLPPDWSELKEQYHSVAVPPGSDSPLYQATDANPSDAKSKLYFNEKGRPVDFAVRLRDTEVCIAQNELLRIAVHTFQNADHQGDASSQVSLAQPLDVKQDTTPPHHVSIERKLFEVFSLPFLGWTKSLHKRALVLLQLNEGSTVEMLIREWKQITPLEFFFPGILTSALLNALVLGQRLRLITHLSSRFSIEGPTRKSRQQILASILHASVSMAFVLLSVTGQVQELRLQPQAALAPSLSLLRRTNNSLLFMRNAIFSIMPAFAVQLLHSQIYTQVHGTISAYTHAFILKPKNTVDYFHHLRELKALESPSDNKEARGSCFSCRLGVILPRSVCKILSRSCGSLIEFLGWNGRSVKWLPHVHDAQRGGRGQASVKSDLTSNRAGNLAATQLAHILTKIVTMPVEGILIRSFVWFAITSPWSSFNGSIQYDLRPNMYSIFPRWSEFHLIGARGALGYFANVGFCLGAESCIRMILVACVSGYSIWGGRERKPHDSEDLD